MHAVIIADNPLAQGTSSPSSASRDVDSKRTSGTKTVHVLFNCVCPKLAAEFLTDDVNNIVLQLFQLFFFQTHIIQLT